MTEDLAHFAPDPDYGRGVYRRRLRFTPDRQGVVAQLDDTHHAAWLTLDHDGCRVTNVAGGFVRAPTTACDGALPALPALRGLPIAADAREALRRLPASAACTHLADLACWALRHVDREATWDVTVPDEGAEPVWIEIAREAERVHRWQVRRHVVLAPARFAGAPLMRGFMSWASRAFDPDALMAATMLQRGVFVARGRRYLVDRAPPMPLATGPDRSGACFAYSGARLGTATNRIGYVRDFSGGVTTAAPPPDVSHRLREAMA